MGSIMNRGESSTNDSGAYRPRIELSAADALRGDFWPPSPKRPVSYDDAAFDESRLPVPPPPGVHPRVIYTPAELERVRGVLASGDKAPRAFRVLWERFSKERGPFAALLTEDRALGRSQAEVLLTRAQRLSKKLSVLDALPDRENLWAAERSLIAHGDPDAPTEIWDLLEFDYLAPWMDDHEKAFIRGVLAAVVKGRVTNFMLLPDHFMVNNHEGFGMEYLRLLLLLEGLPGFEPGVWRLAVRKVRAMLDWYLSPDGMCYESIKGWLNTSALYAVGMRERDLLRHGHLRSKMRFFRAAMRFEDGAWRLRDEMRASAFHVVWMMRHLFPKDEVNAFLHGASFDTHDFLVDAEALWPNPVGVAPELLLAFAEDPPPLSSEERRTTPSRMKWPTTWTCPERGYLFARNSWAADDLHVGFACKQDFFYGGHEGSENNRLTLWKDGVNWVRDVHMLFHKESFLQNMLTVDGKGCQWPPAPGVWLGAREGETGVIAAGDGRLGMSHSKQSQVHPLDFPSLGTGYFGAFGEGNFELTRDLQVAYHPGTVAWNDGYAHAEYGPWHGETRLVEQYRDWNTMEQAFRTVYLSRGKYPYVLVVDDARKDGQSHLFEWNISMPPGAWLVESRIEELGHQSTDPMEGRGSELLIGVVPRPRDGKSGRARLEKGDPLFLIRVLHRNADFGFPVPRLEAFGEHLRVVVPSPSASPEFRILLYPHRFGDPLPKTAWRDDRPRALSEVPCTESKEAWPSHGRVLEVKVGEEEETIHFGLGEAGRTVMRATRVGMAAVSSGAPPACPHIRVRGEKHDPSALRQTRFDGVAPIRLISGPTCVLLENPSGFGAIHYTLDGRDPAADDPVFDAALLVDKSVRLRARVIDPAWEFGRRESAVSAMDFEFREPVPAGEGPSAASKPGFLVELHEVKTVLWDDKGFFRAEKEMLPDLSLRRPMQVLSATAEALPHTAPLRPMREQAKAFYRLRAFFRADRAGVWRFAVESCGPVSLEVAGERAIHHTGVFHQNHRERVGEASLLAGWHGVDLLVCDPLYWNVSSLDVMPFRFRAGYDGEPLAVPAPDALRFEPAAGSETGGAKPLIPARVPPGNLERGLGLAVYERRGLERTEAFFEPGAAVPRRRGPAMSFKKNTFRHRLDVYDGWFHAPGEGEYRFETGKRSRKRSFLGSVASAFQHQIRVDGELVVQRGVEGRFSVPVARLAEGWHRVSVRMGPGEPDFFVRFPDGRRFSLDERLWRTIGEDVAVTTTPAGPEEGLVARYDFAAWDGTPAFSIPQARGLLWIGHDNARREGALDALAGLSGKPRLKPIVDVNVQRDIPAAAFRLTQMKLLENAITVSLEVSVDGGDLMLFGKEGYNAYGKGYETIGASLRGGRLSAAPGSLDGGPVTPGMWHRIQLSADEGATRLWLDGRLVAGGPGSDRIHTDALDFITGGAARVRRFAVWDRGLEADAAAFPNQS